jgi:divalent metal cation (Fe/Co/Zn/Cd) transporter
MMLVILPLIIFAFCIFGMIMIHRWAGEDIKSETSRGNAFHAATLSMLSLVAIGNLFFMFFLLTKPGWTITW